MNHVVGIIYNHVSILFMAYFTCFMIGVMMHIGPANGQPHARTLVTKWLS
jgi:hypothetical protein